MNKYLILLLILILSGCTSGCSKGELNGEDPDEPEVPAQKYVNVEAKPWINAGGGSLYYGPYQSYKTRTVELLSDYEPPEELTELSKYGGRKEQSSVATGFFHAEKIGDRWWCVDPEGHLYLNIAVNTITMGSSERNQQALQEKFGTPDNWIRQTTGILQENYFNCAGSWSDYSRIIAANKATEHPFVYTINWQFMHMYAKERADTLQQRNPDGSYPNNTIFVFDPAFETFCDRYAQSRLPARKDDPNLFGYFSDNELPTFKSTGIKTTFKALDSYLSLPSNDPGYQAAQQWLKSQGITEYQITDSHREAFRAYVADRYFSIVSKVIKKYDPNHLYLGSRFYSDEKDNAEFMKTAGKYLDIIAINYYHLWTPDQEQMANWVNYSGKPFIVSEFYTKGEDSGLPNSPESGAGWIVRTQKNRGLFYQNYVLALLESKNCVGWHWFRYQDNDPTDPDESNPSNVDSNKGIVDNYYEVWTPLMELMKELNSQVYDLVDHFDKK
ncbi:MAG: agarase [Mangrovibacterium sp.]